MSSHKIYWVCLFLFFSLLLAEARDSDTTATKEDLQWMKQVLNTTQDDIKQNYYDPRFHGLPLNARFQEALEKIQSAPNRNYAVADIAGAVSALNDSHTFFVPPPRPYVHDYGWRMQAEGESG